MREAISVRRLTMDDLGAYQVLRDDMLAAYPASFTSEAIADRSQLSPTRYSSRMGEAASTGSEVSWGCFQGSQLQGAITLKRDAKTKLHHTGHIIGMMVTEKCQGSGMGRALLQACIDLARSTQDLELLTLSVTASNQVAVNLYLQAGFTRYGSLPRAIKVGERYLDKDLMVLALGRATSPPSMTTSLQDIAAHISGYNAQALRIAQAREFLDRLVPRLQDAQTVSLHDALGRVLATDVVSQFNVPPLDNSAMDGYALRGAELHANAPTSLTVCGTAFAGQPFEGAVAAGECLRIMTGAVIPAGCDTVVPQEFVQVADGLITVPAGLVRTGDNRRLAGEDLALGEVALKAGRILTPADVGLLASMGQAEVAVFRALRVAFFSTGNELRSVGEVLGTGCVYDSNRYTLRAMLKRLGVQVLDLGVIPDEPAALADAFRQAAENADAIITSGGVSVGEADHTKQVMAQLGDVLFWTVGMRPGRPMAIGRIQHAAGSAILFGLPGNPVAVMVTFYALVRDALLAMSGAAAQPLPLMRVAAAEAIRKKPGRTEYQRGVVSVDAKGQQTVRTTGAQGSGILRSMSEANGLIVLHHDQGPVAAGDLVDVMPFYGLM